MERIIDFVKNILGQIGVPMVLFLEFPEVVDRLIGIRHGRRRGHGGLSRLLLHDPTGMASWTLPVRRSDRGPGTV